MVTLLCLTSLISIVSFDAWHLRKHCSYMQMVERKEELRTAKRSAYAESIYPDAVRQKSKGQPAEYPSKGKTVQVTSKKKKQQVRSLKVPFSRPPNNSRLNLSGFFLEAPENRIESTSWYAIFTRLLKRVYVDTGYFSEGTPHLVAEALLSKKEEILEGAQEQGEDVLATIVFDAPVNDVIYRLLRGSDQYPSLLNFLHYETKTPNQCKLNVFFMDPLLLEVVINHQDAYQKIHSLRQEVWERVQNQERRVQARDQTLVLEQFLTRTDFRKELQEKTQIILTEYSLLNVLNKKMFDYTLGSFGDYMFVTDPYTHIDARVRCSLNPKGRTTPQSK